MSEKSSSTKTTHGTVAAGDGTASQTMGGELETGNSNIATPFTIPNVEGSLVTPSTLGTSIPLTRAGANPTISSTKQVSTTQSSFSSSNNTSSSGSNYVRSISVSSATGSSDRGAGAVKVIPLSTRRGFSIESLSSHDHESAHEESEFTFPVAMSIIKSGENSAEEYKHEHRKISTSNIRKIMKDGVIQEIHETTNQQVKKLQAGDLHYHEARHTQQVRDKLEGDGYSAERVAGKRQDRKVLTCGEQTNERNMGSKAMATRVMTAEGTIDEIAMAKQREMRHFNKGHLEEQFSDSEVAASRTVANAATGVVSKISVSRRQPIEGSALSPLVTSPDVGHPALQSQFGHSSINEGPPYLPPGNQYAGITRQVQDEFRQLLDLSPSNNTLTTVIVGFGERILFFVKRLKTARSKEETIEILQAMLVIVKSAWAVPTYCHDLGFKMCNVLRESSGLAHLVGLCSSKQKDNNDYQLQEKVVFEAASLIEQSLSTENRDYIVNKGTDVVVRVAIQYASLTTTDKKTRVGTGILCHLFKHSEATCSYLLENK
ncbi:sterile alpha and TIR motif-containing protein 1-like, partial [Tropilaelaps mercedesae]